MNIGTIGTSWITSAFINAVKAAGSFTVTAVYSRSHDNASAFAESHGAAHVYTDLVEMAKSKEIDCVYIASPNSLHYEHVIQFLKQKKHVICEKPVFSNTAELKHAHEVAEENDVYLFEAVRNLHSPNFSKLQAESHKIGQVRSLLFQYSKYSSKYDAYLNGENPNIFSLDFSGGALVDLGVYPLYLAVGLYGVPKQVSYHPVILDSGVDGNGTLVLDYVDFTCTIMFSKISNSFNSCEIHGEEATLVFENAGTILNLERIHSKTKEKTSIETVEQQHDMMFEIQNFRSIIDTENKLEYERLRDLSFQVLSITETARKQNNIIFKSEL
ncbi:Gfo/Idh/MocA family protein [Virgibacillus flavescens]|uniref:Gfo/Idh/MocA family protein n=1 Tax=Virgibacillus flavescens TaxID=1611422 RepID=UPI003D33F205